MYADLKKREAVKRMKRIALFCYLSFPFLARAQANQAWLQFLPPPFESIALTVSTNVLGTISTNAVDPEPDGDLWKRPVAINSYFHPGAAFEMRSFAVTGGHGHQACYDANGILIRSGVSAGTADFVSPYNSWGVLKWWDTGHRNADVYPFIRALQLDGNPCLPNNVEVPTNLDRPMIHQGAYLDTYLQRRPPLPTGTRPRP